MEKIVDVQYYDSNFYKCKLLGYYTSRKYDCDFIAFHHQYLPNKKFYIPIFFRGYKPYIFRNNEYLYEVIDGIKEEASVLQSKDLSKFNFDKIFLDPELEDKKIILPKVNIIVYEVFLNDGKEVIFMDLSCLHTNMNWLSKKAYHHFISKMKMIASRNKVIGNYAIVSIRDLSELCDQCSDVVVKFEPISKKVDYNFNLFDNEFKSNIKLDGISEESFFVVFKKIFESLFVRLNKVIHLKNYEAGEKFVEFYRNGKFLINNNDRVPYWALMKYMLMTLNDLIEEVKSKPIESKDKDLEVSLLFYYIEKLLMELQVNEYLDSISSGHITKKSR